jgi:hypothetical protein
MNQWLVLAASAGGVAFMVLVAALLGFRQRVLIDEATLRQLAANEFAQVEASVIDARKRAGVARLSGGKWLVARVMADGVGARVVAPAAVTVRATREGLRIALDDLGYPALQLKLGAEAPVWLTEKTA